MSGGVSGWMGRSVDGWRDGWGWEWRGDGWVSWCLDRGMGGWAGGWIKRSIDGEMIDEGDWREREKDGLWVGAWVAAR